MMDKHIEELKELIHEQLDVETKDIEYGGSFANYKCIKEPNLRKAVCSRCGYTYEWDNGDTEHTNDDAFLIMNRHLEICNRIKTVGMPS